MAERRTLRYVTATVRYRAYWNDRGTPHTTTLTEAEYRALGEKGAGEPPGKPRPQAVWLKAQAELEWNTGDGLRAPGDVTDQFPGRIEVITPQGKRQSFPLAEVTGDVRTPSTLSTTTTRNGCRLINGEVER